MPFKAGDKVRMKESCNGAEKGKVYTLKCGFSDGTYKEKLCARDEQTSGHGCTCEDLWEPVGGTTLETLIVGQLVKKGDGYYRRILADLGGDGELHVYVMSIFDVKADGDDLKSASGVFTAFDLKHLGYSPVTPESDVVELTLEDVAKATGHDVNKIRIKE